MQRRARLELQGHHRPVSGLTEWAHCAAGWVISGQGWVNSQVMASALLVIQLHWHPWLEEAENKISSTCSIFTNAKNDFLNLMVGLYKRGVNLVWRDAGQKLCPRPGWISIIWKQKKSWCLMHLQDMFEDPWFHLIWWNVDKNWWGWMEVGYLGAGSSASSARGPAATTWLDQSSEKDLPQAPSSITFVFMMMIIIIPIHHFRLPWPHDSCHERESWYASGGILWNPDRPVTP